MTSSDQQRGRTTHRITWPRRFVYLAILLFTIALAAHFLGFPYRSWGFSALGGYSIVMAGLIAIVDRIFFNETTGGEADDR